ncbi:MAG: MMPL family transporter [Myxococcales bacterium]|jgi:predicted RND superfamily exporter protein|nr:MMPL family transporter [Myxococcales bacterium]
MLSKLLFALYRLALVHRRKVYVALALLAPLAGLFAFTRLHISTSQKALLPPDHPVQQEYQAFVEQFGAVDALIAVVHGDDPEALRPVADALAAELKSERTWVQNVFHKVDLGLMADHAPYFVPLDTLKRLRQQLEANADRLKLLDGQTSLDEVLATFDALLSQVEASEGSAGGSLPAPEQLVPAIDALTGFFKEWRAFLDDPNQTLPDPIDAAMRKNGANHPMAGHGGYLASRDGRMLFLFVQPTDSSDESAFLAPFLAAMQAAADRTLSALPDELRSKVQIGFTGAPAHVHTEATTVFSDVANGVAGAVVLIIVIIFAGFRTVRKTVFSFVPLVCGMLLALGVIALVVGRLNLISAAFFAVMFGMGIDFSVYLIRRTEEELGNGLSIEEAVRIAVTKSGRGVLFGGLTTVAAFLGTSFTDFSGFSELGITAGIGVFVCLASVFVLTPALMLSFGLEPARTDLKRVEQKFASSTSRRRLWATGIAFAIATIVCLLQIPSIRFDYDALKLLPTGSDSTVLQIRMQAESDMSANSAVVMADSLPALRRIVGELTKSPEVSRVESIADLLPDSQAEKQAELAQIRATLMANSERLKNEIAGAAPRSRPVKTPDGQAQGPVPTAQARHINENGGATQAAPGRQTALIAHLESLTEKLETAQEQAFSGGLASIAAALDGTLTAVTSLREALRSSPGALAGTDAFERAVLEARDRIFEQIATWANATPMAEDKLAPELRARFKSAQGNYVAYVFPTSSVWDVDALDRFIGALRAVTPTVTGFAATHQVFSRMVVSGFYESMAFAFLALLAMLFIDLRRPKAVMFATVPLVFAFALMQGVLRLFGIDYNYASVAAYPVLLGYASDFGLNIVHRWQERPKVTAFVSVMTVGKGVMLSATTSVAALVSIVFARHKGVSDFGLVLLVGISMSFVTAVIVLPTIIDLVISPKGDSNDPVLPSKSKDVPLAADVGGDAPRHASI